MDVSAVWLSVRCSVAEGYEIVAINDLTSPKMLAHLLKYDTAQGNYVAMGHTVSYKDAIYAEDGKTVVTPGSITVDGKEITIYAEPKAVNLPWKALDVDVVLGMHRFLLLQGKESGSHRRRRQESCYFRSRGQRPSHRRLRRKRRYPQSKRYHHLRSQLHDKLPCTHGESA